MIILISASGRMWLKSERMVNGHPVPIHFSQRNINKVVIVGNKLIGETLIKIKRRRPGYPAFTHGITGQYSAVVINCNFPFESFRFNGSVEASLIRVNSIVSKTV